MKQPQNVAVVIQARLGSIRLPGKVMAPLRGAPMVRHVIERASSIRGVDHLVVAIPDLPEDDELDVYLQSMPEVTVVRGSAADVLSRYLEAARSVEADVIVRVTSDCPLLCPEVSERVLREFLDRSDLDYASNTIRRSFPRGLDTEAVSREALEIAAAEATRESDREHVTPFLWRQPKRFRIHHVVDQRDNSRHRWTVDTPEDLAMVAAILDSFPDPDLTPDYADLLAVADRHPELARINRHVRQKEIDA